MCDHLNIPFCGIYWDWLPALSTTEFQACCEVEADKVNEGIAVEEELLGKVIKNLPFLFLSLTWPIGGPSPPPWFWNVLSLALSTPESYPRDTLLRGQCDIETIWTGYITKPS